MRRELSDSSVETLNFSSQSSLTSEESCSSYCRFSFDAQSLPENLILKPHRSSSDSAYSAMLRRNNQLGFRDFSLLRRVGSGDIGTVYLCRLRGSNNVDEQSLYAMKVVDKDALAMKKKVHRSEIEKKILKMLDHPFLPTLYAEFDDSNFSCILMEYCSGGDLHSLRHKQPHKRFSLSSARFYAAEVLVALEYLHMLGIIYRDLKPENVLVRSDGHIMLSDFDLSLCSDAIPAVESPSTSPQTASAPYNFPRSFSCFFPNRMFRPSKFQSLTATASTRLFVAEPVTARSCSFVGTHEYVAPEVASGRSHGNAVDWWALGIFLYEMIYGSTPFAAPSNEAVLRGIVKMPLKFPTDAPSSALEGHARSLITGLLDKDPSKRIGSKRGAAVVKRHPFFKNLNFALVRSLTPPMVPGSRSQKGSMSFRYDGEGKNKRQSKPFDFF